MTAEQLRNEGRWDEAVAAAADPLERGTLLHERSLFQGDPDAGAEAARLFESARDTAEAQGDTRRLAEALDGLGRTLHARFLRTREPDEEELRLFERALALRRGEGDSAGEAESLFHIGLWHQVVCGDDTTGVPLFERSYRLASDLGDTLLVSHVSRHIGFAHLAAGRADDAWRALDESVRLHEEVGFMPGLAAALVTLGEVAAESGRHAEARRLLERAHELAGAHGAPFFVSAAEAALARLP